MRWLEEKVADIVDGTILVSHVLITEMIKKVGATIREEKRKNREEEERQRPTSLAGDNGGNKYCGPNPETQSTYLF
jgi:hypothetical protein